MGMGVEVMGKMGMGMQCWDGNGWKWKWFDGSGKGMGTRKSFAHLFFRPVSPPTGPKTKAFASPAAKSEPVAVKQQCSLLTPTYVHLRLQWVTFTYCLEIVYLSLLYIYFKPSIKLDEHSVKRICDVTVNFAHIGADTKGIMARDHPSLKCPPCKEMFRSGNGSNSPKLQHLW